MIVESRGDGVHDVIGHGGVDFAGQLDEARGEIEFARLPGKIIRIDGDAVSAKAGAGVEGHEAEGLGRGASMTSQMSIPMRRLSIFSSLTSAMLTQRKMFSSSLAISAARVELTGNDARDNLRVKPLRGAAARRIYAADDFGNLRQAKLFVAGIFAFGRKGEKEIARDIFRFRGGSDGAVQAALFEDGQHKLFGGAGIGRGFENDQLAPLQMGLDGDAPSVRRRRDRARGAHPRELARR